MTLIRHHDIRENDVDENAGISNIPWEYEYGFQRTTDPFDDQVDVLDELYKYEAATQDESVLDGLSPDRPKYRGNEIVQVGTFTTRITVRRNGQEVCVTVNREYLIEKANEILRSAAETLALAIQREYVHEGPHLTMSYEMCPTEVNCIVIGDDAFPLRQLLDLRGFPVVGKMEWPEDVD